MTRKKGNTLMLLLLVLLLLMPTASWVMREVPTLLGVMAKVP